jgi:hypothetical protein
MRENDSPDNPFDLRLLCRNFNQYLMFHSRYPLCYFRDIYVEYQVCQNLQCLIVEVCRNQGQHSNLWDDISGFSHNLSCERLLVASSQSHMAIALLINAITGSRILSNLDCSR